MKSKIKFFADDIMINSIIRDLWLQHLILIMT